MIKTLISSAWSSNSALNLVLDLNTIFFITIIEERRTEKWRDPDLRDTIMTRTMNLKPYTRGANRATATIRTVVAVEEVEEVTIILRVTDALIPAAVVEEEEEKCKILL